MVQLLGYVKIVVFVKDQPTRAAELTFPGPGSAPLVKEVARLIENGYAVEPLIGNVGVTLLVQRDGSGPGELPVSIAEAAEVPDELLIHCDHADPLTGLEFISSV